MTARQRARFDSDAVGVGRRKCPSDQKRDELHRLADHEGDPRRDGAFAASTTVGSGMRQGARTVPVLYSALTMSTPSTPIA